MSPEQEDKVSNIQDSIDLLILELHEDLGVSIAAKTYASVEGVAFQIQELAKAHGHVSAAAFRKP